MQLSPHLDTECADLPGQPKVGTFLAVDVRRMVEDNFRVLLDRRGWGAAGASSGAYCAMRLVFDHPEQYAAVVSMSGYFTIETDLPAASTPAVRAQDPLAVARTNPPPVDVLVWAGSRDLYEVRRARAFLAEVRPPTAATEMILPGGRHLTVDFARMMPATFAFLSAHLAGPA
jgi:poly(3-hydroxybutyrate) depolymerase